MIIKLNEHNLQREIARLGVHPASCGIFAAKSKILPLKLTQVRTPAANILITAFWRASWRRCRSSGWRKSVRICRNYKRRSSR